MNRGTSQNPQEQRIPLFSQTRKENLTPQSKTIMLECNRSTSIDAESNKDYWRWKTEYPSGCELLAGDMVRMSSSYINSIGVGDLIRFNLKGDNINNKATWIQSYYGIDDGINQKREGYNMRTDSNLEGGLGKFPYDSTNRPCRLERNTKTNDIQTSSRTNSYSKISWYQDPYLNFRFFGQSINMDVPIYSNLLVKVYISDTNNYSFIDFYTYDNATTTFNYYDPRQILSIGQQIQLKARVDPNLGLTYFKQMIEVRVSIIAFNELLGNYRVQIENLYPSLNSIGGYSDYISVDLKICDGDCRLTTNNYPYGSFYNPEKINYKYENENTTTPQEYYAVQIKTISEFNNPTENLNSKTTILTDDDNEIIKCYMSYDDVSKGDIIYEGKDFKILDLNVGGDTSKIQIQFIGNEIGNTSLLYLNTRNIGNSLCLYIPRPNNTIEIASITNFYFKDYAETTYNASYDGSSTFTFFNVKRNIDLRLSNYPSTVNTTIPSDSKLIFFSRIALDYIYYLNPYKKQYIETSIDQSTITPISDDTKIYYGVIKKPNNSNVASIYQGVSDNSTSFVNSLWGLEDSTDNTNIYSGSINYIYGVPIINPIIQVLHFNTFQYEITQEYNSPSDIATKLTQLTHKSSDNRNKYGEIVKNSRNKGMISNDLFFPVYSSNNSSNTENSSGFMNIPYDTGSFQLLCPYYKATHSIFDNTHFPEDSVYPIYFRTNKLSINVPHVHGSSILPDFNQSANPIYSTTYGKTITDIIGFPITNTLDSDNEQLISQYIGSNNVSFSWNTSKSRFEISYLHQPYTSTYTEGGQGGTISAKIYFPNPQGKDNYPYKQNCTRIGGVNIEHWYSNNSNNYNVPNDVYKTFTTKTFFDNLDGDNFFLDLNENNDAIGKAFWNKLGYSDFQLNTIRGIETDPTSGYYKMLGSTGDPQIILDIPDGLPIASQNSVNFPHYFTTGIFEPNGTNELAKYKFSSIGALNVNSSSLGYSIPTSTTGAPIEFKANSTNYQDFNPLQSTFNVDRERFPYFTITIDSDSITGENLPIKQENPYYLLVSDIVDSNFRVSKNGIDYNVVGIVSKLNFSSDFIFGYTSPISYFIKKDRLLNTINIEIRNPDLSPASDINANSSIIFEIVRNLPNTLPDQLPTPLWYKQNRIYNQIEQYKELISKQLKGTDTSKAQRIESIMDELNSALRRPDENQSELLNRIISNYQNIGISKFKNSPSEMRKLLVEHPLAQEFIQDLEKYKDLKQLPNRLPTDIESIDPETIENLLYSKDAEIASISGFAEEASSSSYAIQNTEEENNQSIINEMERFMRETEKDENLSDFDKHMVENILHNPDEDTDKYEQVLSLFEKRYTDLNQDEKKLYHRYYSNWRYEPRNPSASSQYKKSFVENIKEHVEQQSVPKEEIDKLLEEIENE